MTLLFPSENSYMLSLAFVKASFSLLPNSKAVSPFNRYGITRILGFSIFANRSGLMGKPIEICWKEDACILHSLAGWAETAVPGIREMARASNHPLVRLPLNRIPKMLGSPLNRIPKMVMDRSSNMGIWAVISAHTSQNGLGIFQYPWFVTGYP